jgi:glycosyltransferase involved in cell wall biosynthesis
VRPVLDAVLDQIKRWDMAAAKRVTRYVAISRITQDRIRASYGRDSTVVYPPVDTERFGPPETPEKYFLFVGEVVSHKRIEVAIDAAKRAKKKVRVVGSGPEQKALADKYAGVVEFVGRVSDDELNGIFARSTALIVPNVEEFGIAAVESMAAGRPVIAIDAGGTSETVVDGQTGILVPTGSVEEFAEVMATTNFNEFAPEDSQANAKRFSRASFRRAIAAEVEVMKSTPTTPGD